MHLEEAYPRERAVCTFHLLPPPNKSPETVLILAILTPFEIKCLKKVKTLVISLCNDCIKHPCLNPICCLSCSSIDSKYSITN